MDRVAAADERRLSSIRSMFERFGFPASEADVRARTVYLVQIGYISMQVIEDRALRMDAARAALDAGVDAQILYRLSQAPDHPTHLAFPEGTYLKGLVVRIGE